MASWNRQRKVSNSHRREWITNTYGISLKHPCCCRVVLVCHHLQARLRIEVLTDQHLQQKQSSSLRWGKPRTRLKRMTACSREFPLLKRTQCWRCRMWVPGCWIVSDFNCDRSIERESTRQCKILNSSTLPPLMWNESTFLFLLLTSFHFFSPLFSRTPHVILWCGVWCVGVWVWGVGAWVCGVWVSGVRCVVCGVW